MPVPGKEKPGAVRSGNRAKGIFAMTGLPGRRPRLKFSKDERMRRLRLGDLRKLLRDRCHGPVMPDDDAGREYLVELLLPISLGPNEAIKRSRAVEIWGPTDRMRREIETWAPWMSEDETEELLTDINLMPMWQRKPMARTLGERLQVTYAERARLQLRTIGPCDMTEAAMALLRKQKKRQRDKLRRQRKPRAEYLAASLAQTKPWIAAGFNTRRTWERNGKPIVAGVRHINLIKTECILATEEKNRTNAGECDRLPTATPAGPVQTYPNLQSLVEAAQSDWLTTYVPVERVSLAALINEADSSANTDRMAA